MSSSNRPASSHSLLTTRHPKTHGPHVRAALQLSNQARRRPPVQPRGKTWCCSPGVVQGKVQGPGPNVVSEALVGEHSALSRNLRISSTAAFRVQRQKQKQKPLDTPLQRHGRFALASSFNPFCAMCDMQCATLDGSLSASCCRHRVAVSFLP